jgi:hypothetical protein
LALDEPVAAIDEADGELVSSPAISLLPLTMGTAEGRPNDPATTPTI